VTLHAVYYLFVLGQCEVGGERAVAVVTKHDDARPPGAAHTPAHPDVHARHIRTQRDDDARALGARLEDGEV